MKLFKTKVMPLLLAILMLVSISLPSVYATETDSNDTNTIQIITFNDFHGNLNEGRKELGFAKFVAAIKAEKEANPNTLVVSAGDNYQGSAMSNLSYGQPVSEMFKMIDLTASAIGNHEFDWGAEKIKAWSEEGGFDFLATNIYDRATNEPVDFAKPYKIVEQNGVKIAFLGLATTETAYKAKAEYVDPYEFKDPAEAAKVWVEYLKEGKAEEGTPDLIIALTHIPAKQDNYGSDIAIPVTGEEVEALAKIEGIDAIVSGHNHASVAGYIGDVAVVEGYKNGRSVGKLVINLNEDKTVKDIVPSVVNLYKEKDTVTPDPDALAAFDKWNVELGPVLDKVLGKATGEFEHGKHLDTNVTSLGRWVCEVMAEKAGVQIAIQNGGGLRREIPEGDITYGLLYEVMPFDNTLVTMELLGEDLIKNIEHGLGNETVGNASFSGINVLYNKEAEFGSRIISITLPDGTPIKEDEYYTVVINDFMYPTGDKFDFTNAKNVVNTFIPIRDVLVEAVEKEGTLTPETPVYVENFVSTTYVVKEGDVLWKIAKEHGTTFQQLGIVNKLKNVHKIFVGDKLLVPSN